MIEQSASIAALAAALSKVQATVEGALKDSNNPHFKSKYADLSSVWAACRDQLTAHGLSVVQFPGEMVDNRMTMTTQLSHESGEWMRGTLSIPLTKTDAQGYGSAVTYARRYALAAVVGVCPEDDDGNAASRPEPRQQQSRQAQPQRISDDQYNILVTLLEQTGTDVVRFNGHYGVDKTRDLPVSAYDHAYRLLSDRLNPPADRKAA